MSINEGLCGRRQMEGKLHILQGSTDTVVGVFNGGRVKWLHLMGVSNSGRVQEVNAYLP